LFISGEEWYNYDNKNDREGFCPLIDVSALYLGRINFNEIIKIF